MMNRSTTLQRLWNTEIRVFHVRLVFRMVAVLMAAMHTYAAIKSQSMNADGISYLDIGDAYFRGDWVNAVNPVWSPLYSWILGFINFIFKPSMAWEFPSVHIVNFLIFLAALASFEFMWASVRTQPLEALTMPEPFWWALGYLLFLWTSLSMIQIWAVTPDMLMAVFVLLAAGLIARMRSGEDDLRLFPRLGLVLALGYLAKTFMFSTALVFLVLSWLVQPCTWASFRKTLVTVFVFLLISLPYIALISNVKGSLTIGEAGTVTYVRHVVGIPYPHWQGDAENNILPAHPSHVIHTSPAVYEFGEPIHGTYSIALDPSYWYEGIEVPFEFTRLLTPLLPGSMYYLELFFQKQGTLVACVLVLYVLGQRQKRTFADILRTWALVLPALAAFGLYAFVLVEDRYVGVFVLLFWADILANIRLPNIPVNTEWLKVTGIVAATGLMAGILLFNLDGFVRLNPAGGAWRESSAPAARPLVVARALQELGIQPGDKVGVIGYAYDSFWARLAHVRITAEMLDDDAETLWRGDAVMQQSVLQSFADSGIRAVIAEYVPSHADMSGWQRIGETSFYIYIFPEQ